MEWDIHRYLQSVSFFLFKGRVDTTLMLSEPCEIEMCVGQNKVKRW